MVSTEFLIREQACAGERERVLPLRCVVTVFLLCEVK